MLKAITRRVAMAVPTVIGVTIIVFLLMTVLPGDPAASLLPEGASAAERAALRAELGLDAPLPVRYARWVADSASGDLGYSPYRRREVSSLLAQAWGNTAVLAVAAALFGLVVGVALGATAAVFRGRLVDRALSMATLTGLSVPSFWAAIILLIVFSVNLGVLPASGMGSGSGVDLLRHLVLPVVAASLVTTSITARVTRASMVEMFSSDFVDTLRAKGLRGARVLWHVAKNALGPILTTAGLQFGYLLGGSVLIETIFRWPGMGTLVFNAISARDLLVVQGAILVIAVGFVLINLLVDVVQVAVDPRLKRAVS